MKEFLPEIDDLIAKVLTDEATTKEQVELKTWLRESPENKQYFDALKRVWEESAEAATILDVNADVAWAKVKKRISSPKPLTIRWLSLGNVLKAAAAVLLLFTVFQFLNKKDLPQEQTYTAQSTIEKTTLTDGSAITLNKKSSLTTVFSKKERRVRLQGEAYFAVAKDKEKPFIIDVNTLEVKVVGTAFKIDNHSQPTKVIVVVDEGIVEVNGRNDTKRLTKNEKAIYDIATGYFEKIMQNDDVNAMAFKSRELIFENNTTLKQAIDMINDFYGSSVEITSPAIKYCPISRLRFNIDKMPLDSVLEIITLPNSIEIERDGGKTYLKGNGCN
jgi:transmembrane sensor